MALAKAIEDYDSIMAWSRGLREQWGGDPLAEEPERVAAVQAFCEFIDQEPDDLIAFCFMRKRDTGRRFASIKRRDAVAEHLTQFRQARGLPPAEARRMQSHVLSFLIHNGVYMQLGPI